MATQMEIHFCETIDNPKTTPIIWFFEKRIANQFLKKKWSKKLFILPRHILEPIYILFDKYEFFDFFLIDTSKFSNDVKRTVKDRLKQVDIKNVLLKYKPSIKFDHEEKNNGEHYLKKIGLHKKNFFLFTSRSSQFHNEDFRSNRNSNLNDIIPAAKFLVSKGFGAIKIGKNKKIDDNDIIDYGSSVYKSDFLDVYLASKCEFMITSLSGVSEFATLFRKPKLFINYFDVHNMTKLNLKWIILLKKFKDLNTGKLISFKEAYEKKLNYIENFNELNEAGYKAIDNSELEIKKATENLLNLIENNYDLNEILQKQKNYWKIMEKYFGYTNRDKTIICPDFYQNNIDLFN